MSASLWIVRRQSLSTSSKIFSTFSIILLVPGCPERLSFSTDTRPALKLQYHSKTAVWLKECSPKASQSISTVSTADLPSFTQTLMQTHCSTAITSWKTYRCYISPWLKTD
jgi:hypothetical protein